MPLRRTQRAADVPYAAQRSNAQALIERIPFGRTGHVSSRIVFGAAALGGMKQDCADRTLVLEHGVNHIDTAADTIQAWHRSRRHCSA